jgi:A/G-specific adenine glycosylase
MDSGKQRQFFTRALMEWHNESNDRSLPWKNEKDPYKVWLSEVILQQTRAQQGLPYYLAFTGKYPTVADLAAADEQEAFRLWQGLGYYNRCKNMLATAKLVASQHHNLFPATYDQLLELKGIGPYTAAAIASFAFGLPHAVVDGNVYRVLSRFFGIDTPFDVTEGKKQFAALAQQLLHTPDSSSYNQAIMDLGATVCTPKAPKCDTCPLQKSCFALKHDLADTLPVRSKKVVVKQRFFNYLLLTHNNTVWITKRTANDIWQNLHEPYLIETTDALEQTTLSHLEQFKDLNLEINNAIYICKSSQRLTHQVINAHFFRIELGKKPKTLKNGLWYKTDELKNIAFPKTVVSFFKNNLYF